MSRRPKTFINVEGEDTFPVRLPRNRIAFLVLPRDFRDEDAERVSRWLKLIAEDGADNLRLPGPPESNGDQP